MIMHKWLLGYTVAEDTGGRWRLGRYLFAQNPEKGCFPVGEDSLCAECKVMLFKAFGGPPTRE